MISRWGMLLTHWDSQSHVLMRPWSSWTFFKLWRFKVKTLQHLVVFKSNMPGTAKPTSNFEDLQSSAPKLEGCTHSIHLFPEGCCNTSQRIIPFCSCLIHCRFGIIQLYTKRLQTPLKYLQRNINIINVPIATHVGKTMS